FGFGVRSGTTRTSLLRAGGGSRPTLGSGTGIALDDSLSMSADLNVIANFSNGRELIAVHGLVDQGPPSVAGTEGMNYFGEFHFDGTLGGAPRLLRSRGDTLLWYEPAEAAFVPTRVGEVIIMGNEVTRDNVIRRKATWKPLPTGGVAGIGFTYDTDGDWNWKE